MYKETKPEIPSGGRTYEKCPVYWCRFCDGSACTLRRDDSMKRAVCIRDLDGTRRFFANPGRKK